MKQLIPDELLKSSNKVLFITHLAIGDFAYLQTFFKSFSEKYPHIKMDIWVDEVRRTRFFWLWKHFKKYVLIDWISGCGLFNKIYAETYSWGRFYEQRAIAKSEGYSVVISLCSLRSHFYAKTAREICPKGFVAVVVKTEFQNKVKKYFPDIIIPFNQAETSEKLHIMHTYKEWFTKLFGDDLSETEWLPFINIPREWTSYAKLKFTQWGIPPKRKEKVVFVNSFAKNVARCWPIDRVIRLIKELKADPAFENAYFIVNVEPQYYENVVILFNNFRLERVYIFTAHKNFFQLPAVISLCDVVISVETSVIHLASALKLPIIALMRQKNPEWAPFYKNASWPIFCQKRSDWVEDISVGEVVKKARFLNDFWTS
jgi:heptosyltransferase III